MPDIDLGQDPVSYGDAANPVRQDPWEYIVAVHWGDVEPPPPPPDGMVLCGSIAPITVHWRADSFPVGSPAQWHFSSPAVGQSTGLPLGTMVVVRITGHWDVNTFTAPGVNPGVIVGIGLGVSGASSPTVMQGPDSFPGNSGDHHPAVDLSLPFTPGPGTTSYTWFGQSYLGGISAAAFFVGSFWADVYCPG